MNVLSLFDGISSGHVALDRAGIKVDNYYASEIDKYAITITQANYPDTIPLGDMTRWREWDIDWSSIDLLTAGFPCQAWSLAGKQKGDDDPRGALVHTLIEIWHHITALNPNLKFLFENVKMKKEFLEYINNLFGVEPILINSALVSAQNRNRYYWTNIEGVEQPEDLGLVIEDVIIKDNAAVNSNGWQKWWVKNKDYQITKSYSRIVNDHKKSITMTARQVASWNGNIVRNTDGSLRFISTVEAERLQTLPDFYTSKGLSTHYLSCYNEYNIPKVHLICGNAPSTIAHNPSQVKKLSYAINTILGLLGQGHQMVECLSIKSKYVKKRGVTITSKLSMDFVSNIIKNGNDHNLLIFQNHYHVRFAVKMLVTGGAECVLDMRHQNSDTAIPSRLISMRIEDSFLTETPAGSTIKMQMVDGLIELSLLKLQGDHCEKEKLYTTLILINLIIAKSIFTSAKIIHPTSFFMDSLSRLQGNSLEMKSLALKMECISEISNQNRYKAIGNGWTVDVVAHIFQGLK